VLWEKEHHQWASARAKLSTLNAGAAEDEHTMYVISVVQLAATAKPQKLGIIVGKERLFNA
jgi:hypothetical protein